MRRSDMVLAALAAGGRRAWFDPVQAQKLLFLVDREVSEFVGGPRFSFRPYRYGPYDEAVYDDLDALAVEHDVCIRQDEPYRRYLLTENGYAKGSAILDAFPEPVSRYMIDAARWVRSLTFRQLLSAIYRHYPEMGVNSVISRSGSGNPCASLLFPMPSFAAGMARTFDFMGTIDDHRSTMSDDRVDALARRSDWKAVGDDLKAALERNRSFDAPP